MKGYQMKINTNNYHNGRARYFHYHPELRKVLKVLLQWVLREGTHSLGTAPHGALPAAHKRRLQAHRATESVCGCLKEFYVVNNLKGRTATSIIVGETPPAGVFRADHLEQRTATRVINGQTLVTGVAVASLELDGTAPLQ